MKKLILLTTVLMIFFHQSFSQKFGFVDSDNILKQIPEYKRAQGQIDQISAEWQSEIEKMYQEIDKMYKAYQAEEILLTEEMKKEKQNAIMNKEKSVKEYQKKKFGFEGELFQKRQELVKPVQDKVYEAIKKVAREKQLQFVFDRSSELIMLYADEKFNYSQLVLQELGISGKEDSGSETKSEKKPESKSEPKKDIKK